MNCPDCGQSIRADGTCGNLCQEPEEVPYNCEECGEPATHLRDCTDVTPTDRGDWVQHYQEWQCDACDPGWNS